MCFSVVFLLFHGFFVATLQLWNWKLALWGPHVFYFCRNCRSISWTACLLASKKKELNGFPYEGRCGEMFHKQPTNESFENDYSGSFDVLSEISLLSFCIQPKRWIPFPIPIMSWCDLTQKRAFGWDMLVRKRAIGEFGVYVDAKSVNVQHHQLSKSH